MVTICAAYLEFRSGNADCRDNEIHTFSGDAVQIDPDRDLPGWDNVQFVRTGGFISVTNAINAIVLQIQIASFRMPSEASGIAQASRDLLQIGSCDVRAIIYQSQFEPIRSRRVSVCFLAQITNGMHPRCDYFEADDSFSSRAFHQSTVLAS